MKNNVVDKNMELKNEIKFRFPSLSVNEGIARATVAAFCAQLDPTPSELADIKCIVSEAVTNCIVHGYKEKLGMIYITVRIFDKRIVKIEIRDKGKGIKDVKMARQPLFTTDAENERSGMGFTVMESFSDKILVNSKIDCGTKVTVYKKLEGKEAL